MALIKCTECGHMISDKAEKCPKCGCPIEKRDNTTQQEIANSYRPAYNGNNRGWKSTKMLYAIIAVLVVALAVCGYWLFSNKGVSDKNMETDDSLAVAETKETMDEKKKLVKERLTYIYDQVFKYFDDSPFDGSQEVDVDALWLTTEFYDLVKRCNEIGPDCWDCDHWLQAQDYEKPSMTIDAVEMISDTEAIAKIKIRAFYNYAPVNVKVTLKYERGNWFIDDFGGEKEGIRDYLITNGY